MAIYQKDRDFHKLFTELDVDVIPLRFIKDIICILQDGTKVTLDESDFNSNASNETHIEMLIKELDFYEVIADLKIRIDFDQLADDVHTEVDKILSYKKI